MQQCGSPAWSCVSVTRSIRIPFYFLCKLQICRMSLLINPASNSVLQDGSKQYRSQQKRYFMELLCNPTTLTQALLPQPLIVICSVPLQAERLISYQPPPWIFSRLCEPSHWCTRWRTSPAASWWRARAWQDLRESSKFIPVVSSGKNTSAASLPLPLPEATADITLLFMAVQSRG